MMKIISISSWFESRICSRVLYPKLLNDTNYSTFRHAEKTLIFSNKFTNFKILHKTIFSNKDLTIKFVERERELITDIYKI